ncbi:hypothetical protein ABW21_db0208314 [Orbilia brochopaga]|nr:hypothetical protein ABW21_db0208314 [Drechslerella brochopaga]
MSAAPPSRRSARIAQLNHARNLTAAAAASQTESPKTDVSTQTDASTQTDFTGPTPPHQPVADACEAVSNDEVVEGSSWSPNPAWLRGEPWTDPVDRRKPGVDGYIPLLWESMNPFWLRGAPGAPPFVCRKPIEEDKIYTHDGIEILPAFPSWPDPLDRIPGLLRLLERDDFPAEQHVNVRALIRDLEAGGPEPLPFSYQDGLPVEMIKWDPHKPLWTSEDVSFEFYEGTFYQGQLRSGDPVPSYHELRFQVRVPQYLQHLNPHSPVAASIGIEAMYDTGSNYLTLYYEDSIMDKVSPAYKERIPRTNQIAATGQVTSFERVEVECQLMNQLGPTFASVGG